MFAPDLLDKAGRLQTLAQDRGTKIATAESCTGGLLAGLLTSIPGISSTFERGFVTYSNQSKTDCLNVPEDILVRHGAVSEETAKRMAEGALAASQAHIAISITGIAGPDGGSEEKPVGLVWFGLAAKSAPTQTFKMMFSGNRLNVRLSAVAFALDRLTDELSR